MVKRRGPSTEAQVLLKNQESNSEAKMAAYT